MRTREASVLPGLGVLAQRLPVLAEQFLIRVAPWLDEHLGITVQLDLATLKQLVTEHAAAGEAFLVEALAAGHEGVMVKALSSTYEAGRRGAAWRKVKPVRTLDLECEGLQALRATLDQQLKEPFRVAVATLAAARGRVIVTGLGKSGHGGKPENAGEKIETQRTLRDLK